MTTARPTVLLICDQHTRDHRVRLADTERLSSFADWEWFASTVDRPFETSEDAELMAQLMERLLDVNGVVVAGGAPRITADIIDRAPELRVIGDMGGDRFAELIDLDAAWQRGIRTVDTTNATSYPVAEWALGLILISLRNAGAHFRRMIAGNTTRMPYDEDPGYWHAELMGRRVGLIGCGHIGRRLIKFLRPFETDTRVYDPYLPQGMAEASGVLQTSLDNVLSQSEVIVSLAPLTPRTHRMIGQRELDLIPSGAVLVNVSRGAIIDPDALIARLRRGDVVAALDVFDPEPIPADSEILQLQNVFLTPHISGATATSVSRMFTLMVDEMDRFFHGHETYFDLTPLSQANRQGKTLDH